MKTKLTNILENLPDFNETELSKEIEREMEDYTNNPMPSLTEAKTETLVTGSFADYARAIQNFRKTIQVEVLERHKRGQKSLSDTQVEAIHRICADLSTIMVYDPGDPVSWNSVSNNADLGKG